MQPIFIAGIGTGIGKTLVSAIVTEALDAMYWKPVQAGFAEGTDTEWVGERVSRPDTRLIPETYKLALAASPHIAARREGISISLDKIVGQWHSIQPGPASLVSAVPHHSTTPNYGAPPHPQTTPGPLVIEGAGGLLVPLNETQFVIDLVKQLDATVILVSRNYLGSINHSLLTAAVCKAHNIRVAGWIFNDQYLQYESEIIQWSGIPAIASIPFRDQPDKEFISALATSIRPALLTALGLPG
jgi:dethiobiotin synthetase